MKIEKTSSKVCHQNNTGLFLMFKWVLILHHLDPEKTRRRALLVPVVLVWVLVDDQTVGGEAAPGCLQGALVASLGGGDGFLLRWRWDWRRGG